MKIIATSGMGTKFVATLDDNNNIDKMSRYADFGGGNKDSKGGSYRNPTLWGNYLELPDGVTNVTNDLSDIKSGSRVFVNCSTNHSRSHKRVSFREGDIEKDSENFIQSLKSNPKVCNDGNFDISKIEATSWNTGLPIITVYYWVTNGYTSGNELCEVDLSTLTKKTCEAFSVKNPDSRRKINLKQFSFLVINY